MAAKAIQMIQLNQILQLKRAGFSIKAIVRNTGISRPTVKKYLARINSAPNDTLATETGQLTPDIYFSDVTSHRGQRYTTLSEHFVYAEEQLKRTGVTRQLLWQEYKLQDPDGYNYSQYCYYFSEFLRHKEVVMHLEHKAAETIMIDFAGKKLSYVDSSGGEVIDCQVFVSVLPHSGLIFCKAVHSQDTYDFIDCINAMLRFYGGVSQTILCDNLKTAVSRPSRYEPVFTDMCYQLSEHYGTTFSATRPYRPRDKAMVERCVSIVYNHIYAPLRDQVFVSLRQLNLAIEEQLNKLNDKRYKGSVYSRRQIYEQHEKNILTTLPSEYFSLKKSVESTVQRNYHIQLGEDHRYYSVPYMYAGKKVKVLYDNKTVEIYYDHKRIALHSRSNMSRAYTTIAEHMPSNHQHAITIKGWTRSDLLVRASYVGKSTAKAVEHILSSSIYPEQNYKSCHGLLRLKGTFGADRLEAACARALTATRVNYTMIKNILHAGLDKQTGLFDNNPLPDHDNIRGPEEYQ